MPHSLLIADYGLGLPGSVHDAYAFQLTRTAKDHEELFGDEHWIWADSAYPSETWCVVPFKKPKGGRLTQDQTTFNYHLSSVHVLVEHAFAALKDHFQSLWELHHPVQNEQDLKYLIFWVNSCLILHNMVIHFEEQKCEHSVAWAISENPDRGGEEEEREGDGPFGDQTDHGSSGQRFHQLIMKRLFDSPHSTAVSR
ncbi:hypothetical protein PAXRUDRAFT_163439 [Paxillus rubicundulus Ve08.2h10]|uniref:DDE Tnp4 domain-containing protein n=1 Tax=Paxillus rubicundulus Ve08.2h10 TaxID=930991 RepID=A0A0D0DD82_9AGAM|nr:hypothetical protein PAXRUDRAFT_163439 [Paxillus rubicundulus Ve08.2h10]